MNEHFTLRPALVGPFHSIRPCRWDAVHKSELFTTSTTGGPHAKILNSDELNHDDAWAKVSSPFQGSSKQDSPGETIPATRHSRDGGPPDCLIVWTTTVVVFFLISSSASPGPLSFFEGAARLKTLTGSVPRPSQTPGYYILVTTVLQ
jgi:hypothetical protein